METLSKTKLICDQCGRSMAKVHRRYQGEMYCSTCYYREFKPANCPSCGQRARLHRKHPQAVCLKCEIAGKPCIRCDKTNFTIGKLTDNGPICNSCSVHFRPARNCAYCGETSKYLARDFKAGFEEPACPKCRRKDFNTCAVCRRHRETELAPNGQTICKKCLELGEIICPVCQGSMPAGYGHQCQTCSLERRLAKAVNKHCDKFSLPETAIIYREFSKWAVNRSGLLKTVSTLNWYHKFFLQLEPLILEPLTYPILLSNYGAEGLRRWMQPMGFLTEKFSLEINEDTKNDDSEYRRITKLLNKVPIGTQVRKLLNEYHEHLLNKVNSDKATIKSVRLALTPALGLLKSIREDDIPSQYHLSIYLSKKPGQRAAISGFVGFLKNQYQIDWELPKHVKKSKVYAKKEAEQNLIKLLRNPLTSEAYQQKLLRAQLRFFHGLNIKSKNGRLEVKVNKKNSKYVEFLGKKYWLPDE
jgi:hypothetical protein